MAAFLFRYDQKIGSISGAGDDDPGFKELLTDPLRAIREPEGQGALALVVVLFLVAATLTRRRRRVPTSDAPTTD